MPHSRILPIVCLAKTSFLSRRPCLLSYQSPVNISDAHEKFVGEFSDTGKFSLRLCSNATKLQLKLDLVVGCSDTTSSGACASLLVTSIADDVDSVYLRTCQIYRFFVFEP